MDNGIVIGLVSDLDDPEGLGRVRVTFPHLNHQLSNWARLAVPMAGSDRGFFFRPEKNDEVLVAFEHGDARRPYVIGSLWNKVDKPPQDDGKSDENNWRFMKSRSGLVIKLDDTCGKEKIEIIGRNKDQRITIDASNDQIEIICDHGDIKIRGGQTVKIEATNVQVEAEHDLSLKAGANMSLDASGRMRIRGALVDIN